MCLTIEEYLHQRRGGTKISDAIWDNGYLTYRHIKVYMPKHMRSTVRLKERLRERVRRAITLMPMIEQSLWALKCKATQKTPVQPRVTLPICRAGGQVQPGVDIRDSVATLDRVEGRS